MLGLDFSRDFRKDAAQAFGDSRVRGARRDTTRLALWQA
jgi:hypothetical protein